MNGFSFLWLATLFTMFTTGCSSLSGYTIYPLGWVKHQEPTPLTHEGNIEFFAVSKEFNNGNWSFDSGFGSYVDSYNKRSYIAFADTGHDDFKLGPIQPMISFNCQYKGRNYGSDEMKVICSPPIKFRVGRSDGLVLKVTPVPKIGSLTNGFISLELGYKFK